MCRDGEGLRVRDWVWDVLEGCFGWGLERMLKLIIGGTGEVEEGEGDGDGDGLVGVWEGEGRWGARSRSMRRC